MAKLFFYKNKLKIIMIFLILAFITCFYYLNLYFTFDNIFDNKERILDFASGNEFYLILLLLVFSIFFINSPIPMSALFMIMTGFLFGTYLGALINVIAVTFASYIGFIFTRYVFRKEFEEKYKHKLEEVRKEIEVHGFYYFLSARFIFIIPNFLINILGGLSKISHKNFLLSTFLGSILFSLVYSNIGNQLKIINSVFDVFNLDLFFMLVFFSIISLFPVIMEKYSKKRA